DGYISVREGAVNGPLIGSGYSPLTVTTSSTDDLYVHWNTDDACGTATGCVTTTVQLVIFCPDLALYAGDACDDGDPNTVEDVVTVDCECLGTTPQPCENGSQYPFSSITPNGTELTQISSC